MAQSFKATFHQISYLQYPLYLAGLIFLARPIWVGIESLGESANICLLFIGLAASISSLQDPSKTQNQASLKVWQNPKQGKRFLLMMALTALFLLTIGLLSIFLMVESIFQEMAFGFIAIGISIIGQLRVAIEMFENHRLDKK